LAKNKLHQIILQVEMYRNIIKPLLDFVFALMAVIILSPLMLVISLFCFINFKGHIIFVQKRVGKNERIFTIYKFITMLPEKENNYASDKHRITKAGTFLRSTSLDELPQLFNILFGQMSWIGPRPLLIKYLPYYTTTEHQRHLVKPGITGLAQVNGRNTIDWDTRLQYDITYVKNIRLKTDVQIVIKTVKYVLRRSGVVSDPRSRLADLDIVRRNHKNI